MNCKHCGLEIVQCAMGTECFFVKFKNPNPLIHWRHKHSMKHICNIEIVAEPEEAEPGKLREELIKFANFMENALRVSECENNWQEMPVFEIADLIQEECNALYYAVHIPYPTDWNQVKKEAADVANFCMLLADAIDKRHLPQDAQNDVIE